VVNLGQDTGHGLGRLTRFNLGKYKDKSCYYNSFKTRLWSRLRQGPSHGLRELYRLTWVNVWIKVVIIIVLKPDFEVDPKQGSVTGQKSQPG